MTYLYFVYLAFTSHFTPKLNQFNVKKINNKERWKTDVFERERDGERQRQRQHN